MLAGSSPETLSDGQNVNAARLTRPSYQRDSVVRKANKQEIGSDVLLSASRAAKKCE